ncbi:MAG: L-lactate dehydrogenase [Gammaproteobacteria bacterium]
MAVVTCIEDLRQLHQARVPRMFYDYCDSGAWTESTYRDNQSALAQLKFRQRVAVNIAERSLASRMIGAPVSMPVALAPTGLAGMQYPDGEIHAARAAEAFGVPFTLSTMSICSIEDVAAHTTQPFWFQLYVMRDRGYIERLIHRARDAGCSALVLTLDLQIMGQRHKDIRNGLSTPPRLNLRTALDLARRPGWCLRMLRTRRHTFRNVVGHVSGAENLTSLSQWSASQLDPTLNWRDVDWIRKLWPGPLILKGIMDPEDARLARDSGADAIVVSNHGGRQLDGAPATIDVLPHVIQAVGQDLEVWMDGGIRSGQDVLRALALGARGTMIGRAFLHGLGAMGGPGVTRALDIIRNELDLSMAFCGVRDVQAVSRDILWPGSLSTSPAYAGQENP